MRRTCLAVSVFALVAPLAARSALAQCIDKIYITEAAAGRVSVYDPATGVTPLAFGLSGPEGIAIDPSGTFAWVAEKTGGTIAKVDLLTGSLTRWVSLGGSPVGVAVIPGSDSLVVSSSTGYLFSVFRSFPSAHVLAGGLSDPAGVAASPSGRYIYIAERGAGRVTSFNLTTFLRYPVAAGLFSPYGLALDTAGTTLYITQSNPDGAVQALELGTGALSRAPILFPLASPMGMAVSPGEDKLYVVEVEQAGGFLHEYILPAWSYSLRASLAGPTGIAMTTKPCAHAAATPTRTSPTSGSVISACVDFEDLQSLGVQLGSYGATLSWSPAILEYLGHTGGDAPFNTPFVNAADTSTDGILRFSDADPSGAPGPLCVLCANFRVKGAVDQFTGLDLQITSLYAAGSYNDLQPLVPALDAPVTVPTPVCTIGDVIINRRIDSGDSLIVLASEIALPLPADPAYALSLGCGDANGDAATDSTDANIVLSYEILLPIDSSYPVGRQGNRTYEYCPGTAPQAMTSSGTSMASEPWSQPGITATVSAARGWYRRGQEFEATVEIDLGASGSRLGSYGASLRWDPRAVELVSASGGRTIGFEAPLMNSAGASTGLLRFAHADPRGAEGRVEILRARFQALRALPKLEREFTLDFSSLGATGPAFENLLPLLRQPAGQALQ